MHLNITCPYCGKHFTIEKSVVDVPAREVERVNCYHCKSRIAIETKVRRISKSTMLKNREKNRRERWELRLEAAYNNTADSQVKPWTSLTAYERKLFAYKANLPREE